MDTTELTGSYTYRSFLDLTEPVDDFNKLRFAQLELTLTVGPDGAVSGALVFPTPPEAGLLAMDMVGTATAGPDVRFTLTGKGRPNTPIADFHYAYDGIALRHWEAGTDQRLTLAGTVLRVENHGSGPALAHAGQTASFLAVNRDL
ncbi:hypothetical protein [Streptomyces sp. LBL]|uniref:hypothetical protein n=1 Tax=Streptomyces sp. LBL TaxID=2940562 RepID=UPI002473B1CC|nr:hypothetical protein [Streptomyces sp. LBL]